MKGRISTKKIDQGPTLTQPSQAFTVRQIIDQFARGEVIPSMYQSTDILDDSVPDDEMEDIIEFEDKIDAEGHLVNNQYQLIKDEVSGTQESVQSVPEGPKESTASIVD